MFHISINTRKGDGSRHETIKSQKWYDWSLGAKCSVLRSTETAGLNSKISIAREQPIIAECACTYLQPWPCTCIAVDRTKRRHCM